MHRVKTLYEKVIVIIPVIAIIFAVVASAVGFVQVISNQVMKLIISSGAVQSTETAVTGGSQEEEHTYPGDEHPNSGEPNHSSGEGNSANTPETSGDDKNNVEPSESEQNNSGGSSGSIQGNSPGDANYEELVKPSIVTAKVKYDVELREGRTVRSSIITSISAGQEVVVIRGYNSEWYYIETQNGENGWVAAGALDIPDDPDTNPDRLTTEQLEGFIKYKQLDSPTEYLVWVDIDRQLVNVFRQQNGAWKLDRSMPCSTGRNKSPTLRGTYEIQDRGLWFYNERLQSGAKYWVRYSGPYLFHSIAMNENQEVEDPTLGKRASFGCIRLSIEDSKWFYENIPEKTTVFVY